MYVCMYVCICKECRSGSQTTVYCMICNHVKIIALVSTSLYKYSICSHVKITYDSSCEK